MSFYVLHVNLVVEGVKIEYILVSTLSISFNVTSNSHQPSPCYAKIPHTCFFGNLDKQNLRNYDNSKALALNKGLSCLQDEQGYFNKSLTTEVDSTFSDLIRSHKMITGTRLPCWSHHTIELYPSLCCTYERIHPWKLRLISFLSLSLIIVEDVPLEQRKTIYYIWKFYNKDEKYYCSIILERFVKTIPWTI